MSSTKRVASRYLQRQWPQNFRTKTAGEVIHVKDKAGDALEWAYARGPSGREISPNFKFNEKNVKVLAKVMRSLLAALGHTMTGYHTFTKIKSVGLSPDGKLGGKGYVIEIATIRKHLTNCIEALSSITDTLYDEVKAPHWAAASRQETPEAKQELHEVVEQAKEIKEDPEGWAEEQEEDMGDDVPEINDEPDEPVNLKTASTRYRRSR